jgi:hypothetical protein
MKLTFIVLSMLLVLMGTRAIAHEAHIEPAKTQK